MADSEQGIGKKILGFFIKENAETETSPSPAPAKPDEKQKTVSLPAPTIINKAGTAQIDRKFAEHFAELLEKSNLPGPDYFEYKQALRSMEGLDLSEEKQFQAAWASFKAMGGVTETAVLRTSADQYLGVLDKDRTAFLKDVEKALNERVGALNNEVKKLEENNKAYLQQIADLQKKMDENNNRLGQISGEIAEQSARITANRDNFEITYKSVVDQILADLTKINSYLK
ncbi:hypothetical protein DYBT9275_01927 [Dyadobacter sp. CECT 9275]|uniref:Uncharacterized protein n=1 Tax=Dyadobacter helix TaxID=2822344 RepID=A0A916JAP8_9BACT|nr:hypothetical protein [Dyadobacter sp. CECT 9275]CAG4998102.1 hypothetical protein DYBT9275_01927 [Dyadobacter sp. CECT 9275]